VPVGGTPTLAGLPLLEMTVPDSFQRAGFLQWRPHSLGNTEGVNVVDTGIGSSPRHPQHPTQIVQNLCRAKPVSAVAKQCQGPLQAGGGSRIVPDRVLHTAKPCEGVHFAERSPHYRSVGCVPLPLDLSGRAHLADNWKMTSSSSLAPNNLTAPLWVTSHPGVAECPMQAQLLALRMVVDVDTQYRIGELWGALSPAGHHHGLSPTAAELRGWLVETQTLVTHLDETAGDSVVSYYQR
jgi:hypothetical protein